MYESRREKDRRLRIYVTLLCVGLIAYAAGYTHGITNSESSVACKTGDTRALCPLQEIMPLQRTPLRSYLPGHDTDSYTFFHYYLNNFGQDNHQRPRNFENLPQLQTWPSFFEAYNNHMTRFRNKKVVLMEIGVENGGKIAMLRDYFGPGLTYVGVDANPMTKLLETDDRVRIEVGDSSDRAFLETLKQKYPTVDIFLDGGRNPPTKQQRFTMEVMFPHVAANGIYACEGLNTSWDRKAMTDHRDAGFRESTMMGLVHKTIDWLHYGWIAGQDTVQMDQMEVLDGFWTEPWWKSFASSIKHIHMYNHIVIYEKGHVEQFPAKTIGRKLPSKRASFNSIKVDWNEISTKISTYTGTKHDWT